MGGQEHVARFELVRLENQDTPGGFGFVCEQKTPHLVWSGKPPAHANGVAGIEEVVLACERVEPLCTHYEKLLGVRAAFNALGEARLAFGASTLVIADRGGWLTRFHGEALPTPQPLPVLGAVTFRARHLDLTAAYLQARGIPARRVNAELLMIPATSPVQLTLAFRQHRG